MKKRIGLILISLTFLTSCGKVEINKSLMQESVTNTSRLYEFNSSTELSLDSIMDNPYTFLDYLSSSSEVGVMLNNLTEDDIEGNVYFDDDGNVLSYSKPTLEEYKKQSLVAELLAQYQYTTTKTLNTDNNTLVSKVNLTGDRNYAILQEYSNSQLVLVTFGSDNKIQAIDVFSPTEDRKAKIHYSEENVVMEYSDTTIQLLYNYLTSTKENYKNNLCCLTVEPDLLLELSKTYQRFSITECYKSDNTIIFIDSYEDKNTLIKCSLDDNGVLIGVDIYE
jgi:hypothetical protein